MESLVWLAMGPVPPYSIMPFVTYDAIHSPYPNNKQADRRGQRQPAGASMERINNDMGKAVGDQDEARRKRDRDNGRGEHKVHGVY